MAQRLRLGVNIDHVATVRNARGGERPDPVRAAKLVLESGADSITAHLREDRRHVRDQDIARLKAEIAAPLNLEMAATEEMIGIALKTRPHACCLVPERREERTTEGGLDIVAGAADLGPKIARLSDAGIRVSLFIAADPAMVAMAAELRAPVIELHTGSWADAVVEGRPADAEREFARLREAARQAAGFGLEVHAGHGLDFDTSETLATVPEFAEFNTGHFLIGEAIFVGLAESIRTVRAAMECGRARAAP